MGSLWFVYDYWKTVRVTGWGNPKLVALLGVIVLAIGLSGITADSWPGRFAPLLMGMSLFTLYLAGRVLGKDLFLPVAVGAGVASLGVIVWGILWPGLVTGGAIFEQNYDIVVGYVLLGAALFIHRWQWILAGVALLGMFFSGSPEAVFAVGVLGLVVLLRRDLSVKTFAALAPVVVVAILWLGLGYGWQLYGYSAKAVLDIPAAAPTQARQAVPDDVGLRKPREYRVEQIEKATARIRPLGEGYSITVFKDGIVHNVPLVIVQQLGWPGIAAGLAWALVSVWCLVKTKWKYVWVTMLALAVFDHYVWTQLAPWWWAIVGVSTAGGIGSDLVFKEGCKDKEIAI